MDCAKAKIWKLSPDGNYPEELAQSIRNIGEFVRLDGVGVGLTLWFGEFEENVSRVWLRWCDIKGNIYLTGAERAKIADRRAELECNRAEEEKNRAERGEAIAERLAVKLRELGHNPDEL